MKANTKYLLIGLAAIALLAILYYRRNYPMDGFTDGDTSFTLYYAKWCPHCKDVKPVFEKWIKDNSGSMSVNGTKVTLNIVEESDMDKSVGVKGFPTFLLSKAGSNTEFQGDRSPSGWEAWLKTKV